MTVKKSVEDFDKLKREAPFRETKVYQTRDQNDLDLYKRIITFISVSSNRGVINGDELLSMGIVYQAVIDRINELETFSYIEDYYNG